MDANLIPFLPVEEMVFTGGYVVWMSDLNSAAIVQCYGVENCEISDTATTSEQLLTDILINHLKASEEITIVNPPAFSNRLLTLIRSFKTIKLISADTKDPVFC